MIIEQLMPALSPTMEEGTIASWNVKKGDKISAGQVIAEVQTDKTTVEWEALDDGYVAEILVPAGQQAKVNMVVALLSTQAGEDAQAAIQAARQKNAALSQAPGDAARRQEAAQPAAPEARNGNGASPQVAAQPQGTAGSTKKSAPGPRAERQPTATAAATATAAPPRVQAGNGRVSPVAARIAAERSVPLDRLRGSGPDGRIIKRDVEAFLAQGAAKAAIANPLLRDDLPAYEDVAISPTRAVIGRRLLESKQQIPHYYVSERVDVRALGALRAQLNAIEGVKISVNDLVLRAVALTLLRHPQVNSTFDGKTIRRWNSADISIAVAIPDGLITPILRGVERLSVSEIGAQARELAARAQAGRLQPEEYQGGSFTVSNLGMFGIEQFDAVINPPQAAILAVGGIKDEPVVDGNAVVPGKTMRVTLSSDHRVIDGAVAAAFLRDLRQLLEAPAALML